MTDVNFLLQLVLRQDNQGGRGEVTAEQARGRFSHKNQRKFTGRLFPIRQVSTNF